MDKEKIPSSGSNKTLKTAALVLSIFGMLFAGIIYIWSVIYFLPGVLLRGGNDVLTVILLGIVSLFGVAPGVLGIIASIRKKPNKVINNVILIFGIILTLAGVGLLYIIAGILLIIYSSGYGSSSTVEQRPKNDPENT